MRATRHLLSFAAGARAFARRSLHAISAARADAPDAGGRAQDLWRHRAGDVRGCAFRRRRALQAAVDAFLADPTDATLAAARDAWKARARALQQTEGFRFGNAIVDDWEGSVNSWPLDEGLIDYVDTERYGEESDENPLYTANVIANPEIRIGPDMVDASEITPELLSGTLQEALRRRGECRHRLPRDRVPALGAGSERHRPRRRRASGDRLFADQDCTHGNCDRRGAYLKAATDLLVSDLTEMVGDWKEGGAARQELAAKGADGGLSTILTGLGSLSYGELAGERIKLGLILHDPEEEQDCFSDNTAQQPLLRRGRHGRDLGGQVHAKPTAPSSRARRSATTRWRRRRTPPRAPTTPSRRRTPRCR